MPLIVERRGVCYNWANVQMDAALKKIPRYILLTLFALLASGCTLRIGGSSKVDEPSAPTAVPVQDSAEAVRGEAIVPPENPITLPAGFGISVYIQGLQSPRMMTLGPDGALYVAERGAGRILRLPDTNGDGRADGARPVAEDLDAPSSLAFYEDGSLYVGETTRVLRLSQPDEDGVFQQRRTVISDLPDGGHSTRTVLFSPDFSALFVSIGSSCNICQEDDPRRAAILRYNPDGSGETIFASGLRNAVGLAFPPGSDQLWATNNGRDWLGDDQPPETVYRVGEGQDYGWPTCHAGRIVDPDFGAAGSCSGVPEADVEMQAHAAPLGLEFYRGDQFPAEYRGDLFVALHGSWNRSEPTGYKVVRIPFDEGGVGSPSPVEEFATGWLIGSSAWGRPVDLITGSDGGLFLSDDAGGTIYRIFYDR